jgi:hypothetical protein
VVVVAAVSGGGGGKGGDGGGGSTRRGARGMRQGEEGCEAVRHVSAAERKGWGRGPALGRLTRGR